MDSRATYFRLMASRQLLQRVKAPGLFLELHHIWPRSLGGSDDPSNLVLLTPREHFLAHLLLTDFMEGTARAKMAYALHMMCQFNGNNGRKPTSRMYEEARKKVSLYCRGPSHPAFGTRRSAAQRAAISLRMRGTGNPQYRIAPWNKGLTAATSPTLREAGRKAGLANREHRGWHHSGAVRQSIGDAHRGKPKTEAHKSALSASLKGRGPSREAVEKSAAQNRGKEQPKEQCPHCGKVGGKVAMARWHFENCGERK